MRVGRINFGSSPPRESAREIMDGLHAADRAKELRWEEQCVRLASERQVAVDALCAINAYNGDNIVVIERIASDALFALGIGR